MRMFLENRKMKKIWMPKAKGTLYPLTQVPPEKYFLPNYAWFDYIRPLNKDDIFEWRPKKGGAELKPEKRREAPLQHLFNDDVKEEKEAKENEVKEENEEKID